MAETKTPIELQTQAEHFADMGVEQFSRNQMLLLKFSAQLARVNNLNQIPEDFPPELKELISKNKDAYVLFLRKHRREEREYLEKNAQIYQKKFAQPIALLKAQIRASRRPDEVPGYIGSGSNGSVFRLEVAGHVYAVKFSSQITQNNFEIKPLIKAQGIEHSAQLVAFSLTEGVKVMELLPGDDISQKGPREAVNYPEKHIAQLIDTVIKLAARGIVIDPKPSNFFYDPEEGFSVLDFHLANGNSYSQVNRQVISLIQALSFQKLPRIGAKFGTPEHEQISYEQNLLVGRRTLLMTIKLIKVLLQTHPELLDQWKKQYQADLENPQIYPRPMVDRERWTELDDPEINNQLDVLTALGF